MQFDDGWPTIRQRLRGNLTEDQIDIVIEELRYMLPTVKGFARGMTPGQWGWRSGWNAYREVMREILNEVPYDPTRKAPDAPALEPQVLPLKKLKSRRVRK